MDYLSSELKIEFKSLAIIGYVYSFFISLFFLNYYRNRKFTNCFVFLLNVLHMSLIFFMPILVYITLTTEKSLFFIKDDDKCFLAIKIINMVNQALNKLIYPLFVVYYKSGYISFKNRFTHISLSDVFYELYAYPFILIVVIIFFPLKNELMSIYNNDEILYFLNYLNILDLIYTYFEIGFSCGSILRYFYAVFSRRQEYNHFILGRLSMYQQSIKKDFKRRFTRFYTLSNLYQADIYKYKLNCVNEFISNVDVQTYYDKDHYKKPFEKVENIKKSDLEKVLAKSFGLSKGLFRTIRRIETLRELQINRIKKKYKKHCCCNCLFRCCISGIFKRIKFVIFAAACITILVSEGFYFKNNNDVIFNFFNKTNISFYEEPSYNIFDQENLATNNGTNTTETNVGIQLGSLLLMYPLYLIVIFATCGIYIIPVFYSITKRTSITGYFVYEKGASDTLEMIMSVRKLSSKIFSCLYLSSLFYITFILNETFPRNSKGEYYQFLKFFEVPFSPVVLALRYVYIIAVMVITRLVESINCKCCVFNLNDECHFEPRPCEPCINVCIEPKREKYITAGKREADRILHNSDPNIRQDSNEVDLLSDSSQY